MKHIKSYRVFESEEFGPVWSSSPKNPYSALGGVNGYRGPLASTRE